MELEFQRKLDLITFASSQWDDRIFLELGVKRKRNMTSSLGFNIPNELLSLIVIYSFLLFAHFNYSDSKLCSLLGMRRRYLVAFSQPNIILLQRDNNCASFRFRIVISEYELFVLQPLLRLHVQRTVTWLK